MTSHLKHRAGRRRGERGFTLIEVLVSLVLLSLLLALLTGAVRYARATWDAGARLDRDAGYDAVAFVRGRLAEAVPLFEPTETGIVRLNFRGASDSLSFVAPAANGPAGAGLYRFDLEVAPAVPGSSPGVLAVRVSPYRLKRIGNDPEPPPETHILADRVQSITFRYFGRKDLRSQPEWQSAWTRTDALPDLVEMTVVRTSRDVPAHIVVELRLRQRI
jgi:general secretion pathway protein J